ncbi:enolase-phosphatase E1-like isoform X2 [Panonychus citri]|uniref:enolase-phosphatase E1-like isoform X2 n=1 Tax=Panonychus citri TaxID=50023 RepID=UPI00230756CE|nr:enolase-phosphatase E1-like isoform X2 [Panonychus citri]
MLIRVRRPKSIILDIEGTTTSVRFVSDVLFPYIRTHLRKYLNECWGQPELAMTVDRLRDQTRTDQENGAKIPRILDNDEADEDQVRRSIIANILWQMDEKKNNAALKQLQILVWVYGYEKQHIKGHVFDDVPPALHQWKRELNIKLYLYSTGMIVVQQLLFSCSTHGNLLPLLDDYFDVLLGSKRDYRSFKKIAALLDDPESQILFLTDNSKEARAAIQAGCKALLVKRPGNKPLTETEVNEFRVISSFSDIIID